MTPCNPAAIARRSLSVPRDAVLHTMSRLSTLSKLPTFKLSLLALVLLAWTAPERLWAQGGASAASEASQGDDDAADNSDGEGGADASEAEEEVTEPEEMYEPAEAPTTRAPRTVCQGRRVKEIRVEGVRRVTDDDIRATIRLRKGQPCTDDDVTRDVRAIWGLGFFDDIVVVAEPSNNEVTLTVQLRERPAIGGVEFKGNDSLEQSDIDEKVDLREGEVLSVSQVRKQVTALKDLYAEKGYFLARVDYELVKKDNHEVLVRFVIEEGPEVKIRRIRFFGNHNVPDEDLTAFMQTSSTGIFSFLGSNDTFAETKFDEDMMRLQVIYYDRGYLNVNVGEPRIELTPDREHIDITVPIEEGPRFKVSEVKVSEIDEEGKDVEPLGGRDYIRRRIRTNPGDWFSRSAITENLEAIRSHYRNAGYAKAELVPQTDLDFRNRKVGVHIQVRRGPRVRVERIQIRGNAKTRDLVIRREIRIQEGMLYSQALVERSKQRITALGFFERVDVSEEDGSAEDRVVLNFEVAERPTGTFQIGAGFSSLESFIFTAQIQQQNLFGRGQSLQLNLQLSGIRQLVQARFTEPYLFDSDWTASVEGFKTISQFQDFTRDSTGGGVTLGHPLFHEDLRLFGRYRADLVDIQPRSGGFFASTQGSRDGSLRRRALDNLFQDGLTSSAQLSVTWDSRDNRIFPTAGIHANYSFEVADKFLGSENVFMRQKAFGRFYYRVIGNLVLKLNTEWGLITSRLDRGVPIFERFYLGGIYNVRGFGLNALGPRLALAPGYDPTGRPSSIGSILGGNMQFFYNLELELPILEQVGIRAVAFTDGGNTWNLEGKYCAQGASQGLSDMATSPCLYREDNPLDAFMLRTSWGFGIRWFSPMGPLRFELGFPFRPRDYEETSRFEFTIGNAF